MAFYQGSLEGCPLFTSNSTASINTRHLQSAYSPKRTCFKSKMSDISETNSPRFCSFIFTESHLQDWAAGCNKRVSVLLIRTVDYLVTTRLCMCACTQVGIYSMRFLHQNPSQYLFGKTVKVVTSELSSRVNSFCFYQICACFRIIHLVISLFCSCSCSVTSLRLSNFPADNLFLFL